MMLNKKTFTITLVTMIFGISLPIFSRAQDARPPAPGKMVNAGGHFIHMHMIGKGGPPVIFENGSGDFSFIWDLVQPAVAKKVLTVSYDRAGHAWSQPGSSPRSGRQIAFELHTALHHAGIKGPYILVGQSFGGFLVRYFAKYYKSDVAGIVLVDALYEDARIIIGDKPFRIREWAKGLQAPEPKTEVSDSVIQLSKKPAERLDTTIEFPLNRLSAADQKWQIWAQSQPIHFKTTNDEMTWSPEDVANLYANRSNPDYTLGDIPLIVLSRSKGDYEGIADSANLESERIVQQQQLAALSSNSKHITDSNSGHNIHLEDPGAVINAIDEVIMACRTHTRLK
jgi:pimeloyl-ACP methyl ester carboxylesterase